jgi:hypothetical protein
VNAANLATLLLRVFGIAEIARGLQSLIMTPLSLGTLLSAQLGLGREVINVVVPALFSGGLAVIEGVALILISRRLGRFAAKFSSESQP